MRTMYRIIIILFAVFLPALGSFAETAVLEPSQDNTLTAGGTTAMFLDDFTLNTSLTEQPPMLRDSIV